MQRPVKKAKNDDIDDIVDEMYPELRYFMKKDESDVVFLVGGHRVPAKKELLSLKSIVFEADFYDGNEEIEVKDTTYEAFKTFLQFLYCDQLVLKDYNDFKLLEEVYKLSDRYDISRLMTETIRKLLKIELSFSNFESIRGIAFNNEIKELMSKVMAFIDTNLKHFIRKENKELISLNECTDSRLVEVMANKYRKVSDEFLTNKKENQKIITELTQTRDKLKTLRLLQCKKCKILNDTCQIL